MTCDTCHAYTKKKKKDVVLSIETLAPSESGRLAMVRGGKVD